MGFESLNNTPYSAHQALQVAKANRFVKKNGRTTTVPY